MYDNELFNTQWTTGNLDTISPIVSVVGMIAVWIISLGGFFMVILPIIRNVINGIVCVAPNLCDKIDDAHRAKIELDKSQQNQIQQVIGAGISVFLSVCPNFKALSDFEDGVKDPKSFMITAIPKMCIAVFIGVLVYYGYPSRFADKFATFATGAIDLCLNNVDPEEWVEKIPTMLVQPDFATDNATDILGQNVADVSKDLWRKMSTKYNEMSDDNRIELSHEVEEYVYSLLSEITDKSDSKDYKLTVESRIMSYEPSIADKDAWPNSSYDEDEHIYVYQVKGVVSDYFTIGIPGGVDGDYFMLILKFRELPKESESAASLTVTATVNSGSGSDGMREGDNKVVWTTPYNSFSMSKNIMFNGISGEAEAKYSGKDIYYEVTFNCTLEELASGTGNCSGVWVLDGSDTSAKYRVTKFELGNSYNFVPNDSTWGSFGVGGSPVKSGVTEDDSEESDDRISDDE